MEQESHDEFCDKRIASLSEKFCLKIKNAVDPIKAGAKIYAGIVMLMLSVMLGAGIWSVSASSDAIATAASTESDIEHLKEEDKNLKAMSIQMHGEMLRKQERIEDKLDKALTGISELSGTFKAHTHPE